MSFELKQANAFDKIAPEYKEVIGFTFGVGPYHQQRTSARAPARNLEVGDRAVRLSGSGSWVSGLTGTVRDFGGKSLVFTVHDDLDRQILEPLVEDVATYNEAATAYNLELGVTTDPAYTTATRAPEVQGLPLAFMLAYQNVQSGGAAMRVIHNVLNSGAMLNAQSVKDLLKGEAADHPILTAIPQGSQGIVKSPGGIYVHVQDLSLPGQNPGARITGALNDGRGQGAIPDLDYVFPWSTLAVVTGQKNLELAGFSDLENLAIVPLSKELHMVRESYGLPLLRDLFMGLRGEKWIANAKAYTGNVRIPEDNDKRALR
jgi:hypothetical protein